jgi:hypothetical protein
MFAMNRTGLCVLMSSMCVAAIGCGSSLVPSSPTAIAGMSMKGTVFGGQQPVTGSHVYIFAAGSAGYGSASSSRITVGTTGVTTDGTGNGYVTTDGTGSFAINGQFTCPSSTSQIYFLAEGGNPGLTGTGTISNSAIMMISAIGACGGLSTSTVVNIDEMTTAASVVALQQFIKDGTDIGTSASNAAGLTVAGNLVTADLVDASLGVARSTTLSGTGTVPQAELNTLADMLAPCVNTAMPSSSDCQSLFSAATPSGGTAPTDVLGAMLLIAQNPSSNVSLRYKLVNSQSPFQPVLTGAPNDFSVGVTFKGGGLVVPGAVVIDASGDAWTANCPTCYIGSGTDSVVGFGPYGAVLSGTTGYTAGIHKPGALAFDELGNLWSVNASSGSNPDQVVKQTGATLDFAFSDSTISVPTGIAIDGGDNAWVANQNLSSIVQVLSGGTRTLSPVTSTGFSGPAGVGFAGGGTLFAAGSGSNSLLKFNTTGAVTSPAGGYTGDGLNQPTNVSIDGAGRIFTVNNNSSLVSVINGADGSSASTTGYAVGISNANDLAVDGNDTVWYANCSASCGTPGADNVGHFTAAGALVPGSTALENTSFSHVSDLAIDGSGNLWISNTGGQSVTELIGLAGPITTPVSVAANSSKLGQLR